MVGVGGPPVDPAVEGQAVLVLVQVLVLVLGVLEVDPAVAPAVVVLVALLPEALVGGALVVVGLVPLDPVGEDLSTAAGQHMVLELVQQAPQ